MPRQNSDKSHRCSVQCGATGAVNDVHRGAALKQPQRCFLCILSATIMHAHPSVKPSCGGAMAPWRHSCALASHLLGLQPC